MTNNRASREYGLGPDEPAASGAADASGLNVHDTLARAAREIDAVHGASVVQLWLHDSSTRTMRLVAAVGPGATSAEPVEVDSTLIGEPIRSGRAHLAPGPEVGDARVWRYTFPLAAGPVRGVCVIDILADDPDMTRLTRVAAAIRPELAASLIGHVAAQESRLARSTVDGVCALVGLVDRAAILEELLDRALALSSGEKGSVMLFEPNTQTLAIVSSRGLPDDVVHSTHVVPGDGMAGWVYATGEPLVVEDLDERSPRGRRHGVRSAVVVPLGDEDGALGVINVGSARFHATLSDSRLEALKALASGAVAALRNADALAARQELFLETVRALSLALETKDPYSYGATQRVYELATTLGQRMRLAPRDLAALRAGALLHDIGMTAAAEDATRRDRPLDTYEWGALKLHPVIAADVLRESTALRDAIPIVYHHHEHFDGGGYVQGIAGSKIPLGARILAVADAFVAMTSPRPYRDALSHTDALGEIMDNAGTQFDPEVVDLLVGLLEEAGGVGA